MATTSVADVVVGGGVESLCVATTGSQSEDGDSSCTSDICLVVTPSPSDGLLRVPPSSAKSVTGRCDNVICVLCNNNDDCVNVMHIAYFIWG